jgi:hypothetical protein
MSERPSKKVSRRGKWSDQITDDQYRAKLLSFVEKDDSGCWIWTGWCNKPPREYGEMYYRGRQWRAHRLSYFLHKGPIPAGKVVCHTCDKPKCINPEHLWVGTQHENLIDCLKKNRHANALKTHCKRGHPLSGDNLEVWDGLRRCVICQRGRYRLRAGWPAELAFRPETVPAGYTREVLK